MIFNFPSLFFQLLFYAVMANNRKIFKNKKVELVESNKSLKLFLSYDDCFSKFRNLCDIHLVLRYSKRSLK